MHQCSIDSETSHSPSESQQLSSSYGSYDHLPLWEEPDDRGLRYLFYGRFERGVKGMQRFLRWPILLLFFTIIFIELVQYFVLRAIIYAYEFLMSRLFDRHHADLVALENSDSYQDWLSRAKRLDAELDHDFYKAIDQSPFYSWRTVRTMTKQLSASASAFQQNPDRHTILDLEMLLGRSYNANTASLGIDNERLYAETFAGTKNILQRYIDTVLEATNLYIGADEKLVPADRKLENVTRWKATYGRTALCLSSGGTIAYYHFGIVRALYRCGRLPQIICGSSGGALVAAIIGTRTDEELDQILTPDIHRYLQCCGISLKTALSRLLLGKKLFDSNQWRVMCGDLLFDDMTFKEAYQKTGRILCITCTSDNKWGAPIVLNYMTTPNVVIRDAVLASAAIPPLLAPITLMCKTAKGKIRPFFDFGKCWSDGCIKNDIPSKQLAEQFNVNYLIVSQVNPHIVPFVYECRGSPGCPTRRYGSGLRGGFLFSAAEALLKLDMRKWMRMISELDLMPMVFSQDWSNLFLQKHWGNVTIYPTRGWRALFDTAFVITDPTYARMKDYIEIGERSTYPKIAMIANHFSLEQTLLSAEVRLSQQQTTM